MGANASEEAQTGTIETRLQRMAYALRLVASVALASAGLRHAGLARTSSIMLAAWTPSVKALTSIHLGVGSHSSSRPSPM